MSLPVVELLLPLALAFIMFSLGLTLVVDDFKRVLTRPKAMLIGLVGQMVLVPVFAFAIALTWGLAPEMAVGLMILAACPGGVSSGLLTHLARGDTALSISLTAVTSVAADWRKASSMAARGARPSSHKHAVTRAKVSR